jgi:formylglycine-generating enzyme required for sulfatase activity
MRAAPGVAPILLALFGVLVLETPAAPPPVPESIRLSILGSNPSATAGTGRPAPATHYFAAPPQPGDQNPPGRLQGWYGNVYPGIDMACYGNGFWIEYAFHIRPGGDPSLIRFRLEGGRLISVSHRADLELRIGEVYIRQKAPVVFIDEQGRRRQSSMRYTTGQEGTVALDGDSMPDGPSEPLNGSSMNIVPAGGQPGGPDYDFFMSKYEITNDQFIRFLNDASKHPDGPRGTNMFFGANGNVWFDPTMRDPSSLLFTLDGSRITYDPSRAAGNRYQHVSPDGQTFPFERHPITGVTWFGAIKYCNWLTLESGRGADQRCYREGRRAPEWQPVTATNWPNGTFGDAERDAWLELKGFRLPMSGCNSEVLVTNRFNEFLKSGAWQYGTNRLYGFGRDTPDLTGGDTRSTQTLLSRSLWPVGFFDGRNRFQNLLTRPNENLFNIFDLTGNVAEWLNDFGTPNDAGIRTVAGGPFDDQPLTPLRLARTVPPASSDGRRGFRPTTTFMPPREIIVHVLFSFHREPPEGSIFGPPKELPIAPPEEPVGLMPAADEYVPSTLDVNVQPGKTPQGVIYKTPPQPMPPPPTPPPPPPVPDEGGGGRGGGPDGPPIEPPGPPKPPPPIPDGEQTTSGL